MPDLKYVLLWTRKLLCLIFIAGIAFVVGPHLFFEWGSIRPIDRGWIAVAMGFSIWLLIAVGQDEPIKYLKSFFIWPNIFDLLIWGMIFVFVFIFSQISPLGGVMMTILVLIQLFKDGQRSPRV